MREPGKRVSWVELYLDLVFVLAVAQLAELIVADPDMPTVWTALGLFVTLWWTWVGFAVLYNRHGGDDRPQRLLFLGASVPVGVAAVAIDPASVGDGTVFAISLGVARLIVAGAHFMGDGGSEMLRRRVTRAWLVSAALFVTSAVVPEPFRYVMWGIGIVIESRATLNADRDAVTRLRRDHDLTALAPADATEALDSHHFAERFGLLLIILLGEVVVEAGQGSVDGHVATEGGWAALVAAMLVAAGLWWLYFDSAVDVNLKVLEVSGGSPTIARAIFAVGHMLPAFALLITAAGMGLLLGEDPPEIAYWLPSIGIGLYLTQTRALLLGRGRLAVLARIILIVATYNLGQFGPALSPHAYVWLLAVWVGMCAAINTWLTTRSDQDANVERFLWRSAAGD
jgi:low temperature requirement protein LtrA